MSENFTFTIVGDATKADKTISQVESGLEDVRVRAERASKAMETISLPKASSGGGGDILDKIKTAVEIGGMAELAHQALEMDDAWRKLTNSAQKFADAGHNSAMVLADQAQLADELNTTLEGTLGAYDAVRDATDNLNLTYDQGIKLTRSLGEIATMSGKSTEGLAGGLNNLRVAFETGQNPSRTLIGLWKQFPELQSSMQESLHLTSAEIVEQAKSGQLSYGQIVRSLTEAQEAHKKFGERVRIYSNDWANFREELGKPIDIEGIANAMMNVDMAIARVIDNTKKLTAQWAQDTEERKKFKDAQISGWEAAKGEITVSDRLNQAITIGTIAWGQITEKHEQRTKAITDETKALSELGNIEEQNAERIQGASEKAYAAFLQSEQKKRDAAGAASKKDFLEAADAQINEQADAIMKANGRVIQAADKAIAKAQQTKEAWAQGLGSIAADFVNMAESGSISIDKLGTALAKLVLQMAATRIGGTGGAFLSALTGGLGGGRNGFDYLGNSSKLQLPGFASGGDMLLRGSGGPDSKLAMWWMTPGESLHVRTPEQRREAANANAGPAQAPVIRPVFQIVDDSRAIVEQGFGPRQLAQVQRKMRRR